MDEKEYGKTRDELYEHLKTNNIYGRRYFYPLVSTFPLYKGLDPVKPANLFFAHKIAEQVICLPIYPDLSSEKVKEIIKIIKEFKE